MIDHIIEGKPVYNTTISTGTQFGGPLDITANIIIVERADKGYSAMVMQTVQQTGKSGRVRVYLNDAGDYAELHQWAHAVAYAYN